MISVIMPAYNGEQFIAQSIMSVLNQTFTDFELIVVDDGSTDRTAEIVSGIQRQDDRVRFLRQENSGQAAARNIGISKSQGDLIAFLDQDDLWIEQKLELQTKAIEASGADIVFSGGYIFSGADVTCETISFAQLEGKLSGPEMFRLLFIENRIPILTAIVRKEALASVGPLEEDRRYQNADDYDLWLRLAAAGATFLALPERLVRYRAHSAQASSNTVRMLQAELAVLQKHQNVALLSREDKSRRFRSVYLKLVRSLLDEGRMAEARDCFRELSVGQTLRPSIFLERALLWLVPRQLNRIVDLADRVSESFSYRISRPVRRLLRPRPRGEGKSLKPN
jgi:glycosyltransferase involved in cell wall biosynthesis